MILMERGWPRRVNFLRNLFLVLRLTALRLSPKHGGELSLQFHAIKDSIAYFFCEFGDWYIQSPFIMFFYTLQAIRYLKTKVYFNTFFF